LIEGISEFEPYSRPEGLKKAVVTKLEEGFGYLCISNGSQKLVESKITFKNMKGLKFRKPNRGT
jgi:hypothetical protein